MAPPGSVRCRFCRAVYSSSASSSISDARSGPPAGGLARVTSMRRPAFVLLLALPLAWAAVRAATPTPQAAPAREAVSTRAALDEYCISCHNSRIRSGELALDTLDPGNIDQEGER